MSHILVEFRSSTVCPLNSGWLCKSYMTACLPTLCVAIFNALLKFKDKLASGNTGLYMFGRASMVTLHALNVVSTTFSRSNGSFLTVRSAVTPSKRLLNHSRRISRPVHDRSLSAWHKPFELVSLFWASSSSSPPPVLQLYLQVDLGDLVIWPFWNNSSVLDLGSILYITWPFISLCHVIFMMIHSFPGRTLFWGLGRRWGSCADCPLGSSFRPATWRCTT